MKVVRLEVQNFRRHAMTKLELPDGVVAVVGPNGAGKSSLLEAIGFALYGPRAAATGKELIRSEDAGPGDPVRVALDLEVGGNAVRIVRELRGKAQTPMASLQVDGHLVVQPVAGSSDEATKAVERLLGLDRDGFFQTVVARQRDLDRLGRLKPAERREFILGLAGIGAVDDAIASARARRTALKLQADEAARHVGDERALAARLSTAIAAESSSQNLLAAAANRLQGAEQDQAQAHAKAEQAHAAHAERVALDQRVHALAAADDAARREAARLSIEAIQLQALAVREAALRAEADRLESAGAELATAQGLVLVVARRSAQLARIEQEEMTLARLRQDAAAVAVPAAPDVAVLALDAEHALAAVARTEQAQAVALERASRARGELASLHALDGSAPCPACRQPVSGEHLEQERRDAAQRLLLLEDEARAVARELEAARAAAQAARGKLVAGQALAQQAALATRQREHLAQRVAGLEATLAALREALPPEPGATLDLEQLRRRAEAAKVARLEAARAEAAVARLAVLRPLVNEAESTAARAAAQLAELRLRLATQPDTGMALAAARSALQQAQAALAASRKAHVEALLAAQAAQQRVASARADVERDQQARARLGELTAELARWTALVGAAGGGLLERFREHLVARTAPAINQEASHLLALFTQGRYTELVLDDGYEVYMGDGGHLLPLERFSGGEQDLAHLALRLGISRLLATRSGASEIRFLALDEVFSSLDAERCDNLLGALRGLTGLYGQVLAVTHLERLQESFDAVVRVGLAQGQASVSVHNG